VKLGKPTKKATAKKPAKKQEAVHMSSEEEVFVAKVVKKETKTVTRNATARNVPTRKASKPVVAPAAVNPKRSTRSVIHSPVKIEVAKKTTFRRNTRAATVTKNTTTSLLKKRNVKSPGGIVVFTTHIRSDHNER
jgi:hypothetical protein